MTREIKTTIVLDGEQKFKREIADAKKNLANLGTQLTLAAAQFKNDNDAMKLVETRSKTLRDEIAQQEKIVQAMAGAVEDSAKKYGENSEQAAKWQAELNRAATRLENLKHELANNEQGLDKNGKAFQTAGNAASDAAGQVDDFMDAMADANSASVQFDFKAFDTAFKNIEQGAQNVINVVKNLAKGAWDTVVDSSNWADDLKTLSEQTGLSLETLQKWSYAANFIDTDVSAMTKGMEELLKKSADGNEESIKLFNTLAVKTRDSKGQLRDEQTLFWETIAALHKMSDESRRNALAQKLFGNSYKELLPLINAGKDAWDAYGEEAEKAGYVLDDKKVDQLGDFNDAIQRMEASFTALKNNISAELAPAMQTISESFTHLLDQFNQWSQSEEGQKALQGLSDAVGNVVKALTSDVDFTALAETVSGAFTKIGEGLSWVAGNPDTVISAIKDSLLVIGGIKIGTTVLSLFTAMKGVGALGNSAFGGLKTLIGKITGMGSTTIPSSVGTFLGDVKGLAGTDLSGTASNMGSLSGSLTSISKISGFDKALGFFGKLGVIAAEVAAITAGLAIIDEWQKEQTQRDENGKWYDETDSQFFADEQAAALEEVTAAGKTYEDVLEEIAETEKELAEQRKNNSTVRNIFGIQVTEIKPAPQLEDRLRQLWQQKAAMEAATSVSEEARESIEEVTEGIENAADAGVAAYERFKEASEAYTKAYQEGASPEELAELYKAFSEASYEMNQTPGGMAAWQADMDKAMATAADTAEEGGKEISIRLGEGIEEGAEVAEKTAEDAGKTIMGGSLRGMQSEAMIKSPSRATWQMGIYLGEGLANGIYDGADEAIRAAEWLAAEVTAAIQEALDIHSPSRVMAELGAFTAQGFALGMEQEMGRVQDAMTRMVTITAQPIDRAASYGAFGQSVPAGGTIEAVIQMDKETVGRMVAPVVDAELQAQVEAVRR